MAQVTLTIGGRRYEMAVRDGQEAHFERLGAIVDQKAQAVGSSMGNINEPRLLLMTALLLADEMSATPSAPPAEPAGGVAMPPELPLQINALADRLERIAGVLEKAGDDA